MTVVETTTGDLRLMIDHGTGIRVYDLHTATHEEIVAPSSPTNMMDIPGSPVECILLKSCVVSCFKSILCN